MNSDKLKFLVDRCCVLGIIAKILNNGDHSFSQPSYEELSLFFVVQNHQLLWTSVHSSPGEKIRVATKASLSRTNEASLSAVISMLERERQGLTNGGGERWHTAEDFCRRDKKTDEERRLRDMWRKI